MSLSNKLSISDVDLKGKRVLIRVSLYTLARQKVAVANASSHKRLISMSHSILIRKLQTTNVLPALYQQSNMLWTMVPKL
jgi:hypothetical protein